METGGLTTAPISYFTRSVVKSNAFAILQAGTIYGKYLRPHLIEKHEEPISAKNGWGVTRPSEKKWIEQQLIKAGGETIGSVSAERVRKLEKQLKTLMFVRKEKIQLEYKIRGQRAHVRDLENKFDAAQIRIRQLEQERDYYFKQSSRFNNSRKESGLPTLPQASPCE
jgi:hypothetical protein